ncbi:MAG TPA: hypothetical protein VMI06_10580 [Terriglobia bacterium]|nr:hypothetical protein [Terriglobia bacterium]
MKLINESRSLFGGTGVWQKSEWVLTFLSFVTGCCAVSIVPFIRKDFGERYLGWLNLFFGYTIVANFTFLGTIFAGLAGAFLHIGIGGAPIMRLFWLAFVALSIYHRREIARKNKAGVKWHSMYLGTSILPLPFSQEIVYKFVEPGLVIGGGWLLCGIATLPGVWLLIAGVSLFINNHIVYYNQRQAILDIRDAEIEAQGMSKAFSGRSASETNGLLVAESNLDLIRGDAGLKEAFTNLSPELKDVLDALPGANSAPESTR